MKSAVLLLVLLTACAPFEDTSPNGRFRYCEQVLKWVDEGSLPLHRAKQLYQECF